MTTMTMFTEQPKACSLKFQPVLGDGGTPERLHYVYNNFTSSAEDCEDVAMLVGDSGGVSLE